MNIDHIDKFILSELQENARITNSELSKRIKLSPSSTLERVKKLESSGLIDRYTALLNSQKVGCNCITFVEVKLAQHGESPVADFFKSK